VLVATRSAERTADRRLHDSGVAGHSASIHADATLVATRTAKRPTDRRLHGSRVATGVTGVTE
jgi:hypothetical protein